MVGAGRPMLLDALPDRRLAAPGDIASTKRFGAAAGKVVVAKASRRQLLNVIVEPQVVGERLTPEPAGLRRNRSPAAPYLRAQQFAGPMMRRACGVLGVTL